MRPTLPDVQQCFAATIIPEDVLASYISILRKDPNCGLVDLGEASVRTLHVLYFPDGVPFDVVLDRTADGWLPRRL